MDKGASIWVLIEASKLHLIELDNGYIDGSKLVRFVGQEALENNWAYRLVVA